MMLFVNGHMNVEETRQHSCWSNGKTQVESAASSMQGGKEPLQEYASARASLLVTLFFPARIQGGYLTSVIRMPGVFLSLFREPSSCVPGAFRMPSGLRQGFPGTVDGDETDISSYSGKDP